MPGTSCPLESLTINGTSTRLTVIGARVNIRALGSGGGPWSSSGCCATVGAGAAGACATGAGAVTDAPIGVMVLRSGSVCGRGASGMSCFCCAGACVCGWAVITTGDAANSSAAVQIKFLPYTIRTPSSLLRPGHAGARKPHLTRLSAWGPLLSDACDPLNVALEQYSCGCIAGLRSRWTFSPMKTPRHALIGTPGNTSTALIVWGEGGDVV